MWELQFWNWMYYMPHAVKQYKSDDAFAKGDRNSDADVCSVCDIAFNSIRLASHKTCFIIADCLKSKLAHSMWPNTAMHSIFKQIEIGLRCRAYKSTVCGMRSLDYGYFFHINHRVFRWSRSRVCYIVMSHNKRIYNSCVNKQIHVFTQFKYP